MVIESLECPSCGSRNASSLGRYTYQCEYCQTKYRHVEAAEIQRVATTTTGLSACRICGDTKELKRCFFCRDGACSKHAIHSREYGLYVCKACSKDGPGREFFECVACVSEAEQKRKEYSLGMSRLETRIVEMAEHSAQQARLRSIIKYCAGLFGVGVVVWVLLVKRSGFAGFAGGLVLTLVLGGIGALLGMWLFGRNEAGVRKQAEERDLGREQAALAEFREGVAECKTASVGGRERLQWILAEAVVRSQN